jgi:hypothetical protein
MLRILHQIESIYETLGLICARYVFRFVGVQFVVSYNRSWNKLLQNALIFVWNLCVFFENAEDRKWSSPKRVLCAIKIIISAYLPEIEYLHLNLKLVISSF